jgi:putative phosphoribosyl transferase
MIFRDRRDAGRQLAARLVHYRGASQLLVLALPRGGVPVAYEAALALEAPLDVFLVRKLGLPGREELAMGAIASGGVEVLNSDVVEAVGMSREVIDAVASRERRELQRQELRYRRGRPPLRVDDHTVILIDDGLATGSTMRAAAAALVRQRLRRLAIAVPVGAAQTCRELSELADEVICAAGPEDFMSVGSWYADFSPTSDDEVERLLADADRWRTAEPASRRRQGA